MAELGFRWRIIHLLQIRNRRALVVARTLIGGFRLAILTARFKQGAAARFNVRLPDLPLIWLAARHLGVSAGPRFGNERLGTAHIALGLSRIAHRQ